MLFSFSYIELTRWVWVVCREMMTSRCVCFVVASESWRSARGHHHWSVPSYSFSSIRNKNKIQIVLLILNSHWCVHQKVKFQWHRLAQKCVFRTEQNTVSNFAQVPLLSTEQTAQFSMKTFLFVCCCCCCCCCFWGVTTKFVSVATVSQERIK